jgi:hypothetical protein
MSDVLTIHNIVIYIRLTEKSEFEVFELGSQLDRVESPLSIGAIRLKKYQKLEKLLAIYETL